MKKQLPSSHLATRSKIGRYIKRLTSFAIFTVVLTVAAGWMNLSISAGLGWTRLPLLELSDEQASILNFVEPFLMFYITGLCALCAAAVPAGPTRRSFSVLSVGFIVLAAGEIDVNSHSTFINGVFMMPGMHGPTAELLPFLALPIGVGLFLKKFLVELPKRYSIRFLIAGVVYVIGVLGLEMVSAEIGIVYGGNSFAYKLAAGAEETCEAVGLLIFIVALTRFVSERYAGISIRKDKPSLK